MINKVAALVLSISFATISACGAKSTDDAGQSSGGTATPNLSLDNLQDQQRLTQGVPTQFRITASPKVDSVVVSADGKELGEAALSRGTAKKFHFEYTFQDTGDRDLTFAAYRKGATRADSSSTFRVHVMAPAAPSSKRLFNAYVLKAVDYLNANYGLLGYNINSQNTHPIQYYKYGTFEPTGKGMTMCVAGTLEVIMTAFDLYSKDTGDYSIYDYLDFKSWSTLDKTTIKAQIWVDPKLKSSGTADALAHFGLGEHVAFKDLQPGGFININRTTGSGHSVTFLSFIDIKGNDVPEYNDSVVGFRYFGSQGHGKRGQGGFSYRHAFFSKSGCPDVPYQRDCNVILSDDQHLLNTGEILDPSLWRHPSRAEEVFTDLPEADPATRAQMHSPAAFDGLTTDDL